MDIETAIDNITDLQEKLELVVSALRIYQADHNTAKSANSISVGSYNMEISDDAGGKSQDQKKVER